MQAISFICKQQVMDLAVKPRNDVGYDFLYKLSLVFLGSMLLAISAQLTAPLFPVPVTLQTLAVLFITTFFGWRMGVATVFLYLMEGSVGLPVFAGFSFGVGITGGYLLGLVLTAGITGYLMEHGWNKNIFSTFAAGLLGVLPLFCLGVSVFACFVGWNAAIMFGVVPFVLAEVLKLVFFAVVVKKN